MASYVSQYSRWVICTVNNGTAGSGLHLARNDKSIGGEAGISDDAAANERNTDNSSDGVKCFRARCQATLTPVLTGVPHYNVKLRIYLFSDWDMNWSGRYLTVTIQPSWKDNSGNTTTPSATTVRLITPMYGTRNTYADGDLIEFDISAYTKEISFKVYCSFVGSSCTHYGSEGCPAGLLRIGFSPNHFQYFDIPSFKIDVSPIPLLQPPKWGTLSNASPYTSVNEANKRYTAVSSYEDRINLAFTYTGDAPTKIEVWSDQSGYFTSPNLSYNIANKTISISGLSPGVNHQIQVRLTNSAGNSGWSSSSFYVRTKYSKPSISLTHQNEYDSGLENVTIYWDSDKSIQQVEYKINNSDWIVASSGLNKTGWNFSVDEYNGEDLYPLTTYNFFIRLLSTTTYDALYSNEVSISCTTYDVAKFISNAQHDITIGDNNKFVFSFVNESGANLNYYLDIGEDENMWINAMTFSEVITHPAAGSASDGNRVIRKNTNTVRETLTPSESNWDSAYRLFISPVDKTKTTAEHNKIPLKARLVTCGRTRRYTQFIEGYIILDGDMRTTHTNVGGNLKRGKVWCRPNESDSPRRGVAWISTENGKWKRGI